MATEPSNVEPRRTRARYRVGVADERILTAAELELMTPDERQRLFNERVITDLSQVDPEFLAKVRAKARELHAERTATDSSST